MSGKTRNKIAVFLSYYLNFLANVPFVLQDNWYKTSPTGINSSSSNVFARAAN